jgi:hypothetical protein
VLVASSVKVGVRLALTVLVSKRDILFVSLLVELGVVRMLGVRVDSV